MKTIYFIDDEEDLCEVIRECLDVSGSKIITFTKLKDALEAAKRNPPDLIFIDKHLGSENSLNRLEEFPLFSRIILCTGSIEEIKNRRVSKVVLKPYDLDLLRYEIYQIMDQSLAA